jgi:hypothetical protein
MNLADRELISSEDVEFLGHQLRKSDRPGERLICGSVGF